MSTTSRKPRPIREVESYKNADGLARCKVMLESGETVRLADLTRPELQQAAKLAFPSLPGNVWLRFASTTLSNLIRQGNLDDAAKAVQEVLANGAATKAVKVAAPPKRVTFPIVTDDPIVDAAPDTGGRPDLADQLAEAVRAIAGAQTQTVDLESIRADVAGLIQAQLEGLDLDQAVKEAVESIGIRRVTIVLPEGDRDLPETHHYLLPKLIQVLGAGLNVFLPGPAGSGKSTLAHQAADALGTGFYSVSFGPTTPTSKLFGFVDAGGSYRRTPFRDAYEHGGIFLGDEIDNGHPGLVAELNQALANGYCAFADGMVKRHADFRMVVTGNTFGRGPDRLFVGRNILDAATLDRFFTLECPVDEALERGVALSFATDATRQVVGAWVDRVQRVRQNATDLKLPVVVSPRASIDGARLLAVGIPEREVEEGRLFAGIDKATRAKIDPR